MQPLGGYSPIFLLFFAFCVSGDNRTGADRGGRKNNFNSHARVGRDYIGCTWLNVAVNFNSHARVGRDGIKRSILHRTMDFNSHARVGRDPRYCVSKVMPSHRTDLYAQNSTVLFIVYSQSCDISLRTIHKNQITGSSQITKSMRLPDHRYP